ncbi:MAG: exo-alpha-sialidase [Candidatus Aureabacteria bacterium]|nr:exo-alpha-sialidase [Candidatus Auribacterota bacterium]
MARTRVLRHAGFVTALTVVFLPAIREAALPLTWRVTVPGTAGLAGTVRPLYMEGFVQADEQSPVVHCASAVSLDDGNLLAAWYGGSREGATDVAIYAARYDARTSSWGESWPCADAGETGRDLGRCVRKLGNAVLCKDARGRVWLFYVSISMGGWSGSAINARVSNDGGRSWSTPRRLVTSPFLNKGTLVRGAPFLYADGSIGLPVYHELFGKYGGLIRIGHDGSLIAASRLSWDRVLLQPAIVALDGERLIAFLRNSGEPTRCILRCLSADGGRTWSEPEGMPLPNPDAAVAAIRTTAGALLLAFNNMEIDRDDLSLAISSDDGATWRVVHAFEQGIAEEEGETRGFSYPFIVRSDDGIYHLLYTWHRKRIKHVIFNEAWLQGRG